MKATAVSFLAGLGVLVSVQPVAATRPSSAHESKQVCAPLKGTSFGLCRAYCHALDCAGRKQRACHVLRRALMRDSGIGEFPCDCEPPATFDSAQGCTAPPAPETVTPTVTASSTPTGTPTETPLPTEQWHSLKGSTAFV